MSNSIQVPKIIHHGTEDIDVTETNEWIDALESVARSAGGARVEFLLQRLAEHASHLGARFAAKPCSYRCQIVEPPAPD